MTRFLKRCSLLTSLVAFIVSCTTLYSTDEFSSPSVQWRPTPLWFWNNDTVVLDRMLSELDSMIQKDCYGGCSILPFGPRFQPDYLSEEYFALYGKAIELCRERGAQMSFYDEYGFPSGSMGAGNANNVPVFKNNHPEKTIHRLVKYEYPVLSGENIQIVDTFPGKLMAVAAYNKNTLQTLSLYGNFNGREVNWKVPSEDGWTAMLFKSVLDGNPNVDYLDAEAVGLYVQDVHEQYYRHFPNAFGTTITSTFFDEPTMYHCNGNVWTDGFNDVFIERYGFRPDSLYPALWYGIGDNTAAARNMMFGTRAKMYSEGFMKVLSDWATAHGILGTGHQDQEEMLNTTSVSGDLMLDGKYMTMPGIDKIGGNRPAEHFYKVVSSSANNWDHHQVMSETYGAMGNISVSTLYNIATEQFTKGITNLIPHAVWYNDSRVTFLPELSWRNPVYNRDLSDFNMFLARLKYILARKGRHVADIAVLYPVQTIQAGHHLDGPLAPYLGGVEIPGLDYSVVSEILTDKIGRDFTYVHPEVLDDRCVVNSDGTITMNNQVNTENFSTIILPGVKAISMGNLKKIYDAWKKGANVIFTTQTPSLSADCTATNEEIRAMTEEILSGATFVPHPDAASISEALSKSRFVPDVLFSTDRTPFNYIHKVIEGRNVYYFGNIDSESSKCKITLKDNIPSAFLMNPRTGESRRVELSHEDGRTVLSIELHPEESVFLIDRL